MAILQLSLGQQRLAAFYAIDSVRHLDQSVPESSSIARLGLRLVRSPIDRSIRTADVTSLRIDGLFIAAAIMAHTGALDESWQLATAGVGCSRRQIELEVFKKIADVCTSKLNDKSKHRIALDRRYGKLSVDKHDLDDMGNRKDYAKYQDGDKSFSLRCLVDENADEWLEVDQIRDEIALNPAHRRIIRPKAGIPSESAVRKLDDIKSRTSFKADSLLQNKLLQFKIEDDIQNFRGGSRPREKKQARSVEQVQHSSRDSDRRREYMGLDSSEVKQKLGVGATEDDLVEAIGDAADLKLGDSEISLPKVQNSRQANTEKLKNMEEDQGSSVIFSSRQSMGSRFGQDTNFVNGLEKREEKSTDKKVVVKRFKSAHELPTVKNNKSRVVSFKQ